jgi:O-antigen ligase
VDRPTVVNREGNVYAQARVNLPERVLTIVTSLPLILSATVVFWMPKGVSLVPYAVAVAIVFSLIFSGKRQIVSAITTSRYLWLLLVFSSYSTFLYFYNGHSFRELKALLSCCFFASFYDHKVIKDKFIAYIVAIATIGIIIYASIFTLIIPSNRLDKFFNPIPYSTYCAVISLIGFSLYFHFKEKKLKLLMIVSFVVPFIVIFITQTRTVIVGLTCSILLVLFSIYKIQFKRTIRTGPIALSLLIISIVAALSIPLFSKTMKEIEQMESGTESHSMGIRMQLWSVAPDLIVKAPILGQGRAYYGEIETLYEQGTLGKEVLGHHAHNQALDVWIKKGIVGLIILYTILFYPLFYSLKYEKELWRKNISIGLSTLYFIGGLTDVPLSNPLTMYLYYFLIITICIPITRLPDPV